MTSPLLHLRNLRATIGEHAITPAIVIANHRRIIPRNPSEILTATPCSLYLKPIACQHRQPTHRRRTRHLSERRRIQRRVDP